MRIAELSTRAGTSVPSIKFYLREGLLPAGVATSRNQAEYSEAHVRRLRLIRALIDVGGLSVTAARDVLTAVDAAAVPDHGLLGVAHYALGHTARRDPALMVEGVVMGTILGETIVAALRRLAQEHISATLLDPEPPTG